MPPLGLIQPERRLFWAIFQQKDPLLTRKTIKICCLTVFFQKVCVYAIRKHKNHMYKYKFVACMIFPTLWEKNVTKSLKRVLYLQYRASYFDDFCTVAIDSCPE